MKKQHKRLNRKGKITLLILLTSLVCLLVGWTAISKEETGSQQTTTFFSVKAKPLLLSLELKEAFASSKLNQAIQRKNEIAREKTQYKKARKDLEKEQKKKIIYLTFDDGPSPDANKLLDVLDQYHVKATFFMIGPNIQDHPSAVKRMVKEHFGVGLHGISHNARKLYSSTKTPLKEMSEDQQILQKVTGAHSQIVRMPYGSVPYVTEGMRTLLGEHGFKIWDWTIDTEDWKFRDQRYVQKAIRDIRLMEKAGQAPVVLMHDKPETIHYLPQLLSYIKRKGYHTKILKNNMAPYTFQCEGRCHFFNK